MWCFFDESYQANVTAIAACLMDDRTLRAVDRIMYSARRVHFDLEHAKDLTKELKGAQLLSNYTFRQVAQYGDNANQELAKAVLQGCHAASQLGSLKVFGAVVYGQQGVLTKLGKDRLARPVADLLDKISAAAASGPSRRRVSLVFDSQICGAEPTIAAAVRRFVAGVRLPNVSHFPLVGVSHVCPGIQLADICAFVLGRKAIGDHRFDTWLQRVEQLVWSGTIGNYSRSGIQRWELDAAGEKLVVCPDWKQKKELGDTGQVPNGGQTDPSPTPHP